MFSQLAALSILLMTACASIPKNPGYRAVWYDDFNGIKGAMVDSSKWNQVTIKNAATLKQIQIYTDRASNAHLSGDGQLYIVPKKGGTSPRYWSSARLESDGSWACKAGEAMIFQSEIRVPDFTNALTKYNGLWPAFWTKGQSCRDGTAKGFKCGEWDIFEVTNNMGKINQGTLHFENLDGAHNGSLHGITQYAGGVYHTWAFKVDRRNSNWKKQSLTWYVDGKVFYHVTGATIGIFSEWKILAQSPFFIILNLAIGGEAGSYGGLATESTVDGFEASMRVKYVAVYKSN
ncbi:hypothetical protein G7Z17_g12283 [Cylindrodendrum hubeiense]|uniref:GH16 domain-containing protein n=1 Tax=Cylindrodendrum hubeiense TaxID=595255 RepID=A0A9P5GY08_9HYPO|nr:hypothetical protein G7Z17_g12283 [Cylindrodendrum hubeiense]